MPEVSVSMPVVYSVTLPMVVMWPIAPPPPCSENQRSPPGPLTMSHGLPTETGNSVKVPFGATRATLFFAGSVNQTLSSEPRVMPCGAVDPDGVGHSVPTPPVLMRPILFLEVSVNQSCASAPAVTSEGAESVVAMGNSDTDWAACAALGSTSRQPITHMKSRRWVSMYPDIGRLTPGNYPRQARGRPCRGRGDATSYRPSSRE